MDKKSQDLQVPCMERFSVELACKHGTNEAIFINYIFLWMKHNRKNHTNHRAGHYWTYGTAEEIQPRLPFFTVNQINRFRESLRKKGVIKTDYLHRKKSDRRTWYTIVCLDTLRICERDYANLREGLREFAKSSVETNNQTNNQSPAHEFGGTIESFNRLRNRLYDTGTKMEQITVFSQKLSPEELETLYLQTKDITPVQYLNNIRAAITKKDQAESAAALKRISEEESRERRLKQSEAATLEQVSEFISHLTFPEYFTPKKNYFSGGRSQ